MFWAARLKRPHNTQGTKKGTDIESTASERYCHNREAKLDIDYPNKT